MHFSKKSGRLSSAGAEIQAFVSHCSANFKQILDCFIPSYKLKYEDSENVKADRVTTAVFNLHQIKRRAFLFGTPGIAYIEKSVPKKNEEIKGNMILYHIQKSPCHCCIHQW